MLYSLFLLYDQVKVYQYVDTKVQKEAATRGLL